VDGKDPLLIARRFTRTAVPRALDICASGGRAAPTATRKQRVDAEARRLARLGAMVVRVSAEEGLDHYAVAMNHPEGNEFDIN
jgi:hypothetical protein